MILKREWFDKARGTAQLFWGRGRSGMTTPKASASVKANGLVQHAGFTGGTHFCAYNGNGNIVALTAASDGSETARYEYGPFAEPVRLTGPAASLNPFRFSTKELQYN
mgnify:CR=1 FL=1